MSYQDGMLVKGGTDFAPVLLHEHSHGHHQSATGVVEDVVSCLDHSDRHGGRCWKLSVSGRPGVMSMSVSPTFSASNTGEFGMSFCTKLLLVVLPEPWVPLIQMITGYDATGGSSGRHGHRGDVD